MIPVKDNNGNIIGNVEEQKQSGKKKHKTIWVGHSAYKDDTGQPRRCYAENKKTAINFIESIHESKFVGSELNADGR